ncbi:MAG: DEAD/DEAH box helicase [Eubacteriales bacterium]|nr:DEAD/DEAH box helicase [Eubacteriales bacterium]
MDIFSQYAPFIQDYIYERGWDSLRPVQAAAGDVLFNSDDNLLLSASTASGKTEAAFFPIITMLAEDPPASVGCIYIAPLKALINDQFDRLNDVLEESGVPVWHWHGDVSRTHKQKLVKNPSGILQITPESLEAMMMRRHGQIPALFGDLRFIVIDEIHSLLRGDRGGQTLCLIERLSKMAGVNPRRIGLSATIGDPEAVGRLLSAGTGRKTRIPKVQSEGMKWRLSMEHFFITPPQAGEEPKKGGAPGKPEETGSENLALEGESSRADNYESPDGQDAPSLDPYGVLGPDDKTDKAPDMADPAYAYIFEHTRGRKCLVFSNSREECEAVTTTMRRYCEDRHEADRFLIHHGNLSASFRESAEELMKEDSLPLTTCATATLELGIDIGKLERAYQIDAPFTVSAFLQRMGRTGRRGGPEEMCFVIREDHAEPRAPLPETIPWKLLQAISLVQLYLEERWVEPPEEGRLPYSLLYHQTMSTLYSQGEMTPAELASRVLGLAYFKNVSQDDYKCLLNHLLEIDHIQRTENGGLIVGLTGEKVANNYKFFAVFQENEEFSVRCESQEIGTIVQPPPVGDKIAIAGHVWVVEDLDIKRHEVYCHPVKGSVPACFGDCAGDINTKILERMKQALGEDTDYPYLLPHAKARLAEARRVSALSGAASQTLLDMGGNMYCLLPWLGSYAFLALERFIKIKCGKKLGLKGFNSVRPYYMMFNMDVPKRAFFSILAEEAAKGFDPLELVYPNEVPVFDKYDEYLPQELVRKGFAYGVLDIKGMKKRISEWADGAGKLPPDSPSLVL